MKKLILLLFTVGVCAAVSVTAADDLKDNSLQIDNSRLEREEELNFGVQSDRIKELFNATDQKKLQEKQLDQKKQLTSEGGQLFSAIQGSVEKDREAQLFQPNSQLVSKIDLRQPTEESTSWEDFLPGFFYVGLVILLVSVTGVISYKVATD